MYFLRVKTFIMPNPDNYIPLYLFLLAAAAAASASDAILTRVHVSECNKPLPSPSSS
jgi:hypothetical protein